MEILEVEWRRFSDLTGSKLVHIVQHMSVSGQLEKGCYIPEHFLARARMTQSQCRDYKYLTNLGISKHI